MSATYWFDGARVLDAVRAGLEEGLDKAAERIAADARQRAPIRKAFREKQGFRFKNRRLTATEQALVIRRANAYYGSEGFRRMWQAMSPEKQARAAFNYSHALLPSRRSANTLEHSRADRQLGVVRGGRFHGFNGATRVWGKNGAGVEPGEAVRAKLTSRGLGEVRSGSAVHTSATGQVQIGGALKASIGAMPAHQTADGMEATVVAAIGYAKFVEFPTTHNRAQPFLLPALKDEQRTFTHDVADSIRSSLRGA